MSYYRMLDLLKEQRLLQDLVEILSHRDLVYQSESNSKEEPFTSTLTQEYIRLKKKTEDTKSKKTTK